MRKELERTNRISVSTVIFIVAVVIGFLTFKKPENVFHTNPEDTYSALVTKKYLLKDLLVIKDSTIIIVDVRSSFEYGKGHFMHATNIPVSHLLEKDSKAFFDEAVKSHKKVHIYGGNPNESSNAWMFLYQLGYTNIDIIDATYNRFTEKFIASKNVELPKLNYAKFMKKAAEGKIVMKKAKKKVLKVRKKKKKGAEGGC